MKTPVKWGVWLSSILIGVLVFLIYPNGLPPNKQDRDSKLSETEHFRSPPNLNDQQVYFNNPGPLKQRVENNEAGTRSALDTPIDFYGIIIDQNDHPIADAQIAYSIVSTLDFLNPEQQAGGSSGRDGRFSIPGKKGAAIYVKVSHPDYLFSPSAQKSFTFSKKPNAVRQEELPTRAQPAVFRLIKRGDAEPLVKLKQVLRNVPKDGQVVSFGLSGGKSHEVTIQAWTSTLPVNAAKNAPFSWRVRLEVPGGGIAAYDNGYQFSAPDSGYVESIEFEMPEGGVGGGWRDRFEGTYFVLLGNGHYARMRFEMIAGGAHFAVVESYYNPSGSRNLRFDPSSTIIP